MIKKWLLEKGLKFLMIAIIIGIGISYLSSSIGGASLSYTSVNNFLREIGVKEGDISGANGCFLCGYIHQLFQTLGEATELFWKAIIGHLWMVMAVGFGIFIVFHTLKQMHESANSKNIRDLNSSEPKLDFGKWFDKVWKTGVRVLLAGAFIGAINSPRINTSILKATTNVIVTPVMYIGTTLSMQAVNLINKGAKCDIPEPEETAEDILTPVLKPFTCVMGTLNTVMLAGAAGGFALMNYSWLGMGGGLFTWIAGLTLVIIFLIIGFDLFFQVLNVLFKLIFIIIFMPLLIAAAAFEEVWGIAKNLMNSAIDMLIKSAISILRITLKITIIYAIVFYSADSFYPGPADGFTTIMPPLLTTSTTGNPDMQTMAVMNVFTTCENASLEDGEMNKNKFLTCFNTQKRVVESKYRKAFDFMDDGFDFFIFMLGVFFLYFWIISPKIDAVLNTSKDEKETFNYGDWLRDAAKKPYTYAVKTYDKIYDKMQGK